MIEEVKNYFYSQKVFQELSGLDVLQINIYYNNVTMTADGFVCVVQEYEGKIQLLFQVSNRGRRKILNEKLNEKIAAKEVYNSYTKYEMLVKPQRFEKLQDFLNETIFYYFFG